MVDVRPKSHHRPHVCSPHSMFCVLCPANRPRSSAHLRLAYPLHKSGQHHPLLPGAGFVPNTCAFGLNSVPAPVKSGLPLRVSRTRCMSNGSHDGSYPEQPPEHLGLAAFRVLLHQRVRTRELLLRNHPGRYSPGVRFLQGCSPLVRPLYR